MPRNLCIFLSHSASCKKENPVCFSTMAIVVASPIPADQLGSLNDLLQGVHVQWRALCRCAHCWNSGAKSHVPTVGVTVLLLYDYCEQKTGLPYCRWMADDTVISSHLRSRGVCSVVSNYHLPYLTTQFQIEHIWVYPLRIDLPNIAHAHRRSVQVGKYHHHYIYSCGYLWFCGDATFNCTEIGSVLWNTIQCVSCSFVI